MYSFCPEFFVSLFFTVVWRMQEVRFYTYENSSTHIVERDALEVVETRGCYTHQKQAYTVDLLVPPCSPSDNFSSKIVRVSYHLVVSWNTIFFGLLFSQYYVLSMQKKLQYLSHFSQKEFVSHEKKINQFSVLTFETESSSVKKFVFVALKWNYFKFFSGPTDWRPNWMFSH